MEEKFEGILPKMNTNESTESTESKLFPDTLNPLKRFESIDSLKNDPEKLQKAVLKAFDDFKEIGREDGFLSAFTGLFEDGFINKSQLPKIKNQYGLTWDDGVTDDGTQRFQPGFTGYKRR